MSPTLTLGYLLISAIFAMRLRHETYGLGPDGRPRRFSKLLATILGLFWPLVVLCEAILASFWAISALLVVIFTYLSRP